MKKVLSVFVSALILAGCSTGPRAQYYFPDFSIEFVAGDKEVDKQGIFYLLRDGSAGLEDRAATLGIEYDFAKKIHNAKDYSSIQKELTALVDEKYRAIGDGLENAAKSYSAAWEPAIKEFSDVVTEITGHGWFYPKYTCLIAASIPGMSNWDGNTVIRIYNEDPEEQRRITAHELVLSHVFHICRKYYSKMKINDKSVWKIAEISAAIILDDERLLKYWKGYMPSPNYMANTIYPQLVALEGILRRVYAERKDFNDYLEQAVELAKLPMD